MIRKRHALKYLALCSVFLIYSCTLLTKDREGSVSAPSGAQLFMEKCSVCHPVQRALTADIDEATMRQTIERMRDLHKADISDNDINELVEYHVSRQKKERAIFQEKCQKCHPGRIFLEKHLSPEQTRAILLRMQKKAGNDISDEDIEIIVTYHAREQRKQFQNKVRRILSIIGLSAEPGEPNIRSLFFQKCSTCHDPSRALEVYKDRQAWAVTINRMKDYSEGFISDREAQRLIDFHTEVQRKEIETFEKSCTVCHTEERIFRRSLSEKEWLDVMIRMQQKAPKLITDEKIEILSNFFHRREMTLASMFHDRCDQCHFNAELQRTGDYTLSLGELVAVAREKFREVRLQDVRMLLQLHSEREKREMAVFRKKCQTCHPEDEPEGKKRTEKDWVLFIADLQEKIYDEHVQHSIKTQINFHRADLKK